ncbi:MAG TPA: hypothetical protein VFF15_05535 [Flavobacteriaceae bacterium]|nr:hypothetical protein [Flavobacteriaceae bacterium]
MILPKGITGFISIDDYFEIPRVDENLILKSIIEFTNFNNNYIFLDIIKPKQNNNYYQLIILNNKVNTKQIILFNSYYPYCSLLKEEISWCEKVFGDLPEEIISYLTKLGFVYLSKTFLDKKVTENNLTELYLSIKKNKLTIGNLKLSER